MKKTMRIFTVSLLACMLLLPMASLAATGKAAAGKEKLPPLDVMLGSMLMVGFHGTTLEPDAPFLKAVQAGHVGHVILFTKNVSPDAPKGPRNIVDRQQVAELTATLRKAAGNRPMFIAVDQEGGKVRRLRPEHGFSPMPSAKEMGRNAPSATGAIARSVGKELHDVGINVNLAPAADVDSNTENPDMGKLERCFSADPVQVAAHVQAFANGMEQSGVIPTLKHFPGQGCGSKDPHLGMNDVSMCYDKKRDIYPFAEAIRNGFKGMILSAHIVNRKLDGTWPASLSKKVVTGLLRQELGWNGVVISDDLQMGAIRKHHSLEETMRLAIEAGVDILLFGNNLQYSPATHVTAFATLSHLVNSGQVSRERIAQSYRRIKALADTVQ